MISPGARRIRILWVITARQLDIPLRYIQCPAKPLEFGLIHKPVIPEAALHCTNVFLFLHQPDEFGLAQAIHLHVCHDAVQLLILAVVHYFGEAQSFTHLLHEIGPAALLLAVAIIAIVIVLPIIRAR
jgi:hypothetical protein